ncbi:MHO_4530 family protein [Mycoplasmopsis arginini]|uniref:MHO_4530 family protein n=1 Tax=Mycoplasmopsis arginini TaxID=2094 RepID=UPI002736EBBB|nr:hypothetical protein [Mycoplasmopsis arginini]MDP4043026.1 hypothetical protein [Mycoplasmopsis arginini]
MIKKIDSLLFIWVLIFAILLSAITLWFIFWLERKEKLVKNQNGFICLELDLQQKRIKYLNGISNIYNEPFFLKKINFLNNRWKKLQDFQSLLDKKSNFVFSNSIRNKENVLISFEKQLTKFSWHKTKVNLEMNFVDENSAVITINWNEINSREEAVFEAINTNISYLLDTNSKYLACGFVLNIKNINNINNFVKLFKEVCYKNKLKNIKVFLDWNKIFFVFPLSKFKTKQANKGIKIIENNSHLYKNLFSSFFAFESNLLVGKDFYNYEVIFDYLKVIPFLEDFWLPNDFSEIEYFEKFKENYDYVLNEINETNKMDFKTISFNNFGDENSKLNFLLTEKKFEALNISDPKILSSLDIYKNFFIKIYENINAIEPHGKVLNVNDFIFNLIDNKNIENAIFKDHSFVQLISLNSKKSMLKARKKIEQIQEIKPKASIAIKLDDINDDIISAIDKWVKIIWFDKNITSRLNNPKIMLYVGLLLNKAEQLNISVVFEKLDYKNYKKILYNNNLNMFYTLNRKTLKEK